MRKLTFVLLLLFAINATALVQNNEVTFRCAEWENHVCPFENNPSVLTFPQLNLTTQTICKAEVAAGVKQIHWADGEGRGRVASLRLNGMELLGAPVHPSSAYAFPDYPHCDDMYSILPPFGNGVVGAGNRMSINQLINTNELPVSVLFEWVGPHEDDGPVCSMSGYSISGLAQVIVYIEAQDNSFCPGWDDETKAFCNGNGQCLCAPNDNEKRTCSCQSGYAEPECRDCTALFYGEDCSHQCQPCLNGGKCDSGQLGTGQCICPDGFDPSTRCSTCIPGFYGPSCLPCPNCNFPHGNCEDGLVGSGRCACAVGFDASSNCLHCMPNFFGPSCAPCAPCDGGVCDDGLLGDGRCICKEGFDPASRCLSCLDDYYGDSCLPCRSCHGHGKCNDTMHGDGTCVCNEGYDPASRCSLCAPGWDFNPTSMACQCAPQHFGPHCLSCPICAPHGHCNSGRDGDGRCICDVGWSDSNNCVGCLNGYFGPHCEPCKKCGNGRCDDGLKGTGDCVCHRGWSIQSDCYDCEQGFYGENCIPCPRDCGHGSCSSGKNGTGECICESGFDIDSALPCTTCLEGHIGPQCQICPGYADSEVECTGHGKCVMDAVAGGPVCHCDVRYNGPACELYDFPTVMVAVLGTIALSTLGICMCTMRNLARQPRTRYPQGPFTNRDRTYSPSEYLEIEDMTDLEYFVSNDTRDWLIPFESLSLQNEVGNGTSGQVFRSLLHSGGGSSVVAVKRLYSPITGQEYFQSFFRREVSILSRLHHPNVVRFYGVSYFNRVLYIVTDFCPKSLSHLIENRSSTSLLEESYFRKIVTQIVSGMGFLHSRQVVHRDLKPANVLISDTEDVNICDFGLSRLLDPDMTSMTAEVGTPSYMAPEMATMGGTKSSTKGDVYSFGILLYSTWSRSKPYGDQGMNPFQLMTAVVNGLRPVIPINCPPALARLMRACWNADAEARPSFPEISLHLTDPKLMAMEEDAVTTWGSPEESEEEMKEQSPSERDRLLGSL